MCVLPNHCHMEGFEVTTNTQWTGPHQLSSADCVTVCLHGLFALNADHFATGRRLSVLLDAEHDTCKISVMRLSL